MPPPFKATGKKISEADLEKLSDLVDQARTTPVIAFSTEHALKHGGLSGQAWQRVYDFIERKAIATGLPRLDDESYGCDFATGEILAPEREEESDGEMDR